MPGALLALPRFLVRLRNRKRQLSLAAYALHTSWWMANLKTASNTRRPSQTWSKEEKFDYSIGFLTVVDPVQIVTQNQCMLTTKAVLQRLGRTTWLDTLDVAATSTVPGTDAMQWQSTEYDRITRRIFTATNCCQFLGGAWPRKDLGLTNSSPCDLSAHNWPGVFRPSWKFKVLRLVSILF